MESGAPPDPARKTAQGTGRRAGKTITAGAIRDIALPAPRPADPARERNRLLYDAVVKKSSG